MAGRPTKLTTELLEKSKTYLGTCVDKPIWTDKGAIAYTEVNLPSKVGLALFLEVDKMTIDNWSNNWLLQVGDMDNKTSEDRLLSMEFFGIVTNVLAEQEKRLISNGLGGLYKEKTTGMLLSKHGYAEKTETDITTKGESITSNSSDIEEIAKGVAEELKKKHNI